MHGAKNVQHGAENVRYIVENAWQGAKNMRRVAKNVQHGAKNVRHGAENVRHGLKNVQYVAEIVQHGGKMCSMVPKIFSMVQKMCDIDPPRSPILQSSNPPADQLTDRTEANKFVPLRAIEVRKQPTATSHSHRLSPAYSPTIHSMLVQNRAFTQPLNKNASIFLKK